ncbi:MAG TPA: hypothetical protein VJ552_09845 [Sediminibacterium sp.]|nr:hypothetical protein [Sediminibacterium sp.]
MNKVFVCNSLLLLLAVSVAAQRNGLADSIYFYQQSAAEAGMIQHNATQLVSSPVEKTGYASLSATHISGGFRRVQQAQRTTIADFYTEGYSTLKRVRIAGSFHFNKIMEDSLAWTMKGLEDEVQPYYFFAGKAGAYERQNYNMDALVAYEMLKNKLYVSLGAGYNYHWTTRSVDPRPDVNNFKLTLHPSVTYRFGKHLVGAGFTWGYGNETTSIAYKNKNYAGNQLYIERNSYLSLGYGHITKMQGRLRHFNDYSGFDASYTGVAGKIRIRANAAYQLRSEELTMDEGNSSRLYHVYSKLYVQDMQADLLLSKQGKRSNQQLYAKLSSQSGDNWAAEFDGSNYFYLCNTLNLSYLYRFNTGNAEPELGAGIDFTDVSREDYVEQHYLRNTFVRPGITANLYWKSGKLASFAAAFHPSYTIPLLNELEAPPTQVNVFTRGVVYSDYLYYSYKALNLEARIQALRKNMFKQLDAGMTIRAVWAGKSGEADLVLPSAYDPNKYRLNISCSFNLYF